MFPLASCKAFTEEMPLPEAEPVAEEAAPAEEVDLEAALGGGIRKAPAAVAPVAAEAAPVEEVDLEAALGGGIRKAPAAVTLDEAPVAEASH